MTGELLDTCQVPAVRSLAAVVEQVEAAATLPEQEAPGTANMDSARSSTADVSCIPKMDALPLSHSANIRNIILDDCDRSVLPPMKRQ